MGVQLMLPDSTASAGRWTAVGDSTLHECVDDDIRYGPADDDTTYASSVTFGEWMKLGLPAPPKGDPTITDNHLVVIRFRWTNTGTKDYQFQLVQQPGDTVIANKSDGFNSTTYVGRILTLSDAEAANITDYSDLELWVMKDHDGVGGLRVTAFELRVPEPNQPVLLGHPF